MTISRTLRTAVAVAALATPALADGHMVEKAADGSVAEVMDRLVAAVEGAGATVFARVDHGAGAESVGMELAEAELLIFGNPQLGTPAMQADIGAGLVLPLRVLVYEGADGTVITYETVEAMFEGLTPPPEEVAGKMAGALDNLTGAAAGN